MGGEEDDGWALPAGVGGGKKMGMRVLGRPELLVMQLLCLGFFNEPLSSCSLATELLLLAGEVQHKHIKMSPLVQNSLLFMDRYTFV